MVSRPAAGSSSRTSLGLAASARATPISLRWPWLRSLGIFSAKSCRRMISSAHSTCSRYRRSLRPGRIMSVITECQVARSAAANMLSRTVRSSKSSSDWNVRVSPRRARWCGATPARSSPSKVTLPAEIGVNPVIASMKVVLPAPFGPISPTSLPVVQSRSIASFALSPP